MRCDKARRWCGTTWPSTPTCPRIERVANWKPCLRRRRHGKVRPVASIRCVETNCLQKVSLVDDRALKFTCMEKFVVRQGLKPTSKKQSIALRVDADVLEWFKA